MTQQSPDVFFTVVIPTHRRTASLRRCLDSLIAQDLATEDFEVIVVVDGNDVETEKMLRELKRARRFRYFVQPHQGPSVARNRGIAEAHGRVVAFIDDDCVADSGWLSALGQAYSEHPEVGGVCGSVEMAEETGKLGQAMMADFILSFDRRNAALGTRYGSEGYVCYYPGYNRSYLKTIVMTAGGYNPRLLAYEDALLGWQLYKKGVLVYYTPRATVRHYHNASPYAAIRRSFKHGRASYIMETIAPDYPFLPRPKAADTSPGRFLRRCWQARGARTRLGGGSPAGTSKDSLHQVRVLAYFVGVLYQMMSSKITQQTRPFEKEVG